MGILSVLFGLGVMVYALFSTATAPGSGTLNLGLLNDRLILAMIGLAFVIVGAAENVSSAVRLLRKSEPSPSPEPKPEPKKASGPPVSGSVLQIGDYRR